MLHRITIRVILLLTSIFSITTVQAFSGIHDNLHANPNRQTRAIRMQINAIPSPDRQSILRHNLAVSLDRPLLDSGLKSTGVARNNIIKDASLMVLSALRGLEAFLASLLASRRVILLAMLFASSVWMLNAFVMAAADRNSVIKHNYRMWTGRISAWFTDNVKLSFQKSVVETGVPMTFDGGDASGGDEIGEMSGWGVCTLSNKRPVKPTSDGSLSDCAYVEYTFDLPQSDNVIPLALGQQLKLCCLDEDQNVCKGDFYTWSPRSKQGSFSIVLPTLNDNSSADDIDLDIVESAGKDGANFARVLQYELQIGDEVAIQPGAKTLEYRGQYLPVTDMLYFVCDMGVVPILDQIKSVLPSGSSSVKNINVVWLNKRPEQFELAYDQLENEFYKYNNKLEVSCCLLKEDDYLHSNLEENTDIADSIPTFRPGTMAVLAGPSSFVSRAERYLKRRGYPSDVICSLP